MELIGKQIAIETILGQPPEAHYPSWYAAQIEKLPPAPPEYLAEQAGILVTDADTISRKAAIDALRAMQTYKLFASDDMLLIDQAGAQTELMLLPPAQPEIIRCRNCKFASGDSRICMKFGHSPIGELDFCAWAERRTE